jgi:plasmid stability protein
VASMTIRDLEEQRKDRLRFRAARNKRSMEEEVRAILKAALAADSGKSKSLTQSIRARIEPLGGVELELPQRDRSEISRSPRSCCFSTPTDVERYAGRFARGG